MDAATCSTTMRVLMLPWLAYGHISPFLELAKKLSKRNCYVYLCSTPFNLSLIREKLLEKDASSIELIELHLPSLPELPPQHHSTKGLPPHLMPTLKEALHMARPNFSNILQKIKPDLLIYDFIQDWAPLEASSLNIPAILFLPIGAAIFSLIVHSLNMPNPALPLPELLLELFAQVTLKKQRDHESSKEGDYNDKDQITNAVNRSFEIILVKTSREIEAKYIDYASAVSTKKIVLVGSLVQEPTDEDDHNDIINWLNMKGESSTLFISFGSEYFLSKEEMGEIAYGLELSKVSFVWVVRFATGEHTKIEEALPVGFLERTKGRGMVVEGWAPQGRILMHPSIGGFMSHCGWSSAMEAMKFGVAIIGMPMQFDQPINARLLQEIGVAIVAKRDNEGRLERNEVARAVKEMLMKSTGEDIRKTARELKRNMANKGEEDIDGAVEELLQICYKRRLT